MPDVFLSYSREDQTTARRFAEALKGEGFDVWWDQALSAGEAFDRVTEKALEEARAVVVLWSKRSVESDWVRAEATQARANHRLVPVTIEACKRPIMFELTHTADLSGWSGDVTAAPWRAFIEGLQKTAGKSALLPTAAIAVGSRAFPRGAIVWSAIAAAILTATGIWYLQSRHASTAAAGAPTSSQTATLASIAVLPFRDMSQNKDQEYFADGVTEEILNALAGLKDLKVTARTSVFAFKGRDVDLRTVGETLGVRHILEGSIRKDGDKLRITAQLIDSQSDAHVWSKTYDRPLQDIFTVQEDIARSVAEALQVALGVGFGRQPGMTRDVEAYDVFLAAFPQTLQYTPENQRRGIGLLERALARDPNFGEAWVSLAGAYAGMSRLVTDDAQEWRKKSDAAIATGLRLVPGSPTLRFELAERSISQSHWSEAASQYQELEADISRLGTWNADPRGRFLLMVGRTRDALAVLAQEKARDPLNPIISVYLAVAYSSLRNFPAAIAEFKRGYPLDPSWQYVFQICALSNALAMRDRAEILRNLDVQIANVTSPRQSFYARIKTLFDRPSDALVFLRGQIRDPSTPPVALPEVSQWLAYFGDSKSALEALRLAFERGAGNPTSTNAWYPVMHEVRKLPGYKQVARDFGFVEYWKKYGWGDFCKPVGEDDFECN